MPGEIRLTFQDDGRTPAAATFAVAGVQGTLHFRGWQTDTVAPEALFEPPEGLPPRRGRAGRTCTASSRPLLNFAAERLESGRDTGADADSPTAISVVARDPAGHGLFCRCQGKTILMVSGTPAQMGTAQGTLLRGRRRRR